MEGEEACKKLQALIMPRLFHDGFRNRILIPYRHINNLRVY